MELRKKGLTYREIAAKEGVSHSTVQEAVVRRLSDTVAEPANSLRELELERLDALLKAVWTAAELGDPDAVASALKVMAQRHKLLGLEAPSKVHHSFDQMTDEQLQAELAAAGIVVQIGETKL
jgi:transcriptional regulator with XRE-family HTH domain